jgi:hypothetical protein
MMINPSTILVEVSVDGYHSVEVDSAQIQAPGPTLFDEGLGCTERRSGADSPLTESL